MQVYTEVSLTVVNEAIFQISVFWSCNLRSSARETPANSHCKEHYAGQIETVVLLYKREIPLKQSF